MEHTIRNARDVYAAVNEERKQQDVLWKEISAKSGVAFETMKGWNFRNGARVDCIVDVLDALDLELVIRRKGEKRDDS